jgi:hypothetical protein
VTTPVPLPARVSLYFGEPMHFAGDACEEDEVVARVEQVKAALRELIARGLAARASVF